MCRRQRRGRCAAQNRPRLAHAPHTSCAREPRTRVAHIRLSLARVAHAALLGLADPSGNGVRTMLLGVQAAASKPCVDNQAVFIYPQAFNDFLVKASRDLGSPLPVGGLSWKDY